MISIYRILFSVAYLILFISCNTRDNSNTNNEDELQYTVHINISESLLPTDDGRPEYLLGQPVFVFTDKSDNIYVADRMAMNIRVYDSTGIYKRTIGKRGRGPGEFLDINAMLIDSQNNIIIADQLNSRISYLSSTGEIISTHLIDQDEILWPRQIREYNDDLYIYLYRLPRNIDPDGNILHVFDKEMNRVKSLKLPDRYAKSPFVRIFSEFYPGHISVVDNNYIVYVPPIFDGTWYNINIDKSANYTVIENGTYHYKPFTENFRGPLPDNVTRIHHGGEVIAADVKRQSLGIFPLSDGKIVIFYLEYEEDTTLLKTELFTLEGSLIGKGQKDLKEVTTAHAFTLISIVHIDRNDTFYVIDDRGLPEIKTMTLTLSKYIDI